MQLAVSDVEFLKELLTVFGEAFREFDTYQSAVPSDAYLRKLLSRPHFIALVAMNDAKSLAGRWPTNWKSSNKTGEKYTSTTLRSWSLTAEKA
jgi:hypothetical protein